MPRSTKSPQEFPAVELLPGLKAQFDPHSLETDKDGVIRPKTKGHLHSFDLDLYGDDDSDSVWIRFHVNDQDGDPLDLACMRLAEIDGDLQNLIDDLEQLDSDQYPYPPVASPGKTAKAKRSKFTGRSEWQVIIIHPKRKEGELAVSGLARSTAKAYCRGVNQKAKQTGSGYRAITVKERKSHE